MGKVKHELEDVLEWHLIGVLCDCEDCDDISDMVTDREEEFKAAGLLKLGNGVPCGDTILRVVESVNPAQLRASLDCCRGHIIESLCGNQVIIDGKKLRGENPRSPGCHGLYILNAWVSETEICVAEKPVDGKTNELTVLPSVLSSLWLTGALVSVDAMGTHRNIAEQIMLQGGDYLMALQDNQPILKGLTESIFSSTTPISVYTTEEKGHGRVEKRTCSIMDTTLLEQEGMYEKWPGLKRIIKMERERTENGARSRETIYYLSSVEKDGGFLLCDAYSCALGYREQTALASRRDVSGRYIAAYAPRMALSIFQRCASMHWKCLKSRTINSALNEDAKMYVEH